MNRFKKIEGDGDVVSTLKEVLAQAERGEIDGVVICTIEGSHQNGHIAFKDETEFAWVRLLGSIAAIHDELLRDGL